MESGSRIAVLGAGLAGLSCARSLRNRGYDVSVFEKAWRPGGRMAARHTAAGDFDHGAQYFTVRHPQFENFVKGAIVEGAAARWDGKIARSEGEGFEISDDQVERFVGTPHMNSLPEFLAKGSRIHCDFRVSRLLEKSGRWYVHSHLAEEVGPFDGVVVTFPAAQAASILPESSALQASVATTEMTPCLTLMLSLSSPLKSSADGIFVKKGPLSWVARSSSKPDRQPGERWEIHGSPAWSKQYLRAPQASVLRELKTAFQKVVGETLPAIDLELLHRWHFSAPIRRNPQYSLLDTDRKIAVAGDWCGGGRVEGAFLSGVHAAARMAFI